MRRLITYFNSMLLGMILGLVFVAVIHALPSHLQETRTSRMEFCAQLVNRGWNTLSSAIARSASLINPQS
jgi:hypothetical protein